MKVIFTIDSLAQGGTEQSIAEMIPHFTKKIEVVVVYFYNAHHLKNLYESIDCRLYYLDIDEKYGFYDAIRKFNRVVKKENPDVVVSSLYRSLIISRFVCWWTQTPLIGTFVNERYSPERRDRFKGFPVVKYYLTWFLDWVTAFIPQKIISNSYSISLLNGRALGIGSNKIKVIYRGRDTRNYPIWKIPSEKNVFVWIAVGRLIPQKGYENLLLAISELKKTHPEVRLRIIGEGPIREELELQIKKLELHNEVFLEGNIPLGWKKLYDAHAFVLPSISEGFSGALVEACITGIPIVASDIPMNTEAITHMRTALVHKLRDDKDLLDKMKFAIEHFTEMKEMGQTARIEALGKYDIRTISSQYENQLQQFIAAKN